MKRKATKRAADTGIEVGDYEATARAFRDLARDLGHQLERVMKMKDGAPEKDRLMLAIRTGLLAEGGNSHTAASNAIHCMKLASFTLAPVDPLHQKGADQRLWDEPDMVAAYVATAAEQLAITIGALSGEVVKMDAFNRLTAKTRRAA